MVIGFDELHRRIKEERLIENLSERELQNPEGVGLDLRIGKVFRIDGSAGSLDMARDKSPQVGSVDSPQAGKALLGVTERETPNAISIAEYKEGQPVSVTLKPGEYLLTESVEKFNMPLDLLGILKPRTTLQRSGVFARMSAIDPGYSGTIHPALFNAGPCEVTIELGARYVNVFFLAITGTTSAYRGQWQGGRVATDGKETQV